MKLIIPAKTEWPIASIRCARLNASHQLDQPEDQRLNGLHEQPVNELVKTELGVDPGDETRFTHITKINFGTMHGECEVKRSQRFEVKDFPAKIFSMVTR